MNKKGKKVDSANASKTEGDVAVGGFTRGSKAAGETDKVGRTVYKECSANVRGAKSKVDSVLKGDTDERSVSEARGAIPKVGRANVLDAKFKIGEAEGNGRGSEIEIQPKVASANLKISGADAFMASILKGEEHGCKSKTKAISSGADIKLYGAEVDAINLLKNLNLGSSFDNTIQTKHTEQSVPIMSLYLSGKYTRTVDPAIFTQHLSHLNLEHCKLRRVPPPLFQLKNIVSLDLSHNKITLFNDTPMFIHTLQELFLENNYLMAPPLWIWRANPRKLKILNLSRNQNLVSTLQQQNHDEYFCNWVKVEKIDIFYCRLHLCTDILYTLIGVQELILGGGSISSDNCNYFHQFPMESLKCIEARIINVNNCKITNLHKSIINYSSVTHLDLGRNLISKLPEEIGDLSELVVLIMSFNKLKSLPISIGSLTKLKKLFIDNNLIGEFPGNSLSGLRKLKCLDMYDNYFKTPPEGFHKLEQFDFAMNCAPEPSNIEYMRMKTHIRNNFAKYKRNHGTRYQYMHTSNGENEDWTLLEILTS